MVWGRLKYTSSARNSVYFLVADKELLLRIQNTHFNKLKIYEHVLNQEFQNMRFFSHQIIQYKIDVTKFIYNPVFVIFN